MSVALKKIWRGCTRHRACRLYELSLDEKSIKVTCYDSLSYHFTKKGEEITSIDPSGGPYFSVGTEIRHNGRRWIIQRISSHTTHQSTAIFVFEIEPVVEIDLDRIS